MTFCKSNLFIFSFIILYIIYHMKIPYCTPDHIALRVIFLSHIL